MPTRLPRAPEDRWRVAPDALRWRCDPSQFAFTTTADLAEEPIEMIGQARAVEALRLGLDLRGDGYNVFVAGEIGTGRSTAVRHVLAEIDRGTSAPRDLAYVHNFKDPDQPRLLTFPAGKGRSFAKAMDAFVESLRKSVPALLDTDGYRNQRSALIERAKASQKEKVKQFEKQVEEAGFALVQLQAGPFVRPEITPVVATNPVALDQLDALVEEGKFDRKEYERLRQSHARLSGSFEGLGKTLREIELALRTELLDLDRAVARPAVTDLAGDVLEGHDDAEVRGWLDDVLEDVLEHLDRFSARGETPASGAERDSERDALKERMRPYHVNVVVDHGTTKGLPVIWETSPDYRNLFGTIDGVREVGGEWKTDHGRIKAGSLARASGGFLVLDAIDVLVEPGVWPALKRTLRNRSLEIRSTDVFNVFGSASLKPAPIPLDVKVLLVGTRHIHRLLHLLDEDFKKIFKIKAELALETPRSKQELQNFARFVRRKCADEALPPFHRDAVAAIAEHAARMASRQDKMTTRFNELADVVRESAYWATRAKAKRVEAEHVDRAIERRAHRLDLVEEVLRERIAEGTILVDLEGEKSGMVNGLVVLDVGDFSFGIPSRITAVTGMGRAGIVNVEREADLSGAIHTKGVLILSGLLRARFAQDKPLALSASLAFEQSYGGVEGDSASCAEFYALVSSLAGTPIRQGIAVTGSVNQRGDIQPIGGTNEKIEGFYELCKLVGLTGRQGVMIPARNVPHLMLEKEVVAAVREGKFHVWAVSTVEEGIEILTGLPAGERGAAGSYPPDSVFGRADARLRELSAGLREFAPGVLGPGA
jgi:ATP-dependent Lon protease